MPWGETFDLNVVESALRRRAYAALTVAHSETSTGVLTDVRAVAELAHRHGAMALVDSVSGAGGAELMVDAWELDFVLTGSQKALALPAGLAFAVASTDYVERAASVRDRGFYFDVLQYEKFANDEPDAEHAGDVVALRPRGADGRHRARGDRAALGATPGDARRDDRLGRGRSSKRRGFDLGIVAPEGARSPTVSVISLPTGMHGPEMIEAVKARGFTIGSGYGQLRETTVRIGHMGDHSVSDVAACLREFEDAIVELAERRRFVRV